MNLPDEDADRTRLRTRIEPRSETTLPAESEAIDEHSNALPAGTALAEFDIVRVIGEGGFGIVYLAFDRSLGRPVALKEYMPSSLARRIGQTTVQVRSERLRETFDAGLRSFVNEARLLAQFDHPALVKVYRFWEASGTAYMVMPHYEGTTLKQTLRQRTEPPSEAWLLGLLAPLIDALAVLHAEHCYHRDIAPDNVILLAGSGAPVLLDFGAARRVIGDKTQALTVVLKSGYAPMEQYGEVSSLKQGPWTDIYALGAVVYFAITGAAPQAAVSRWVDDGCVPLAQAGAGRYSAGFLAAIDRALIVKPELRTQNLEALRADLGLAGAAERTVVRPAAELPPEVATQTFEAHADSVDQPTVVLMRAGGSASASAGTATILHAPHAPHAPHAMSPGASQAASQGVSQPVSQAGSSRILKIGSGLGVIALIVAAAIVYLRASPPAPTTAAPVAAALPAPAAVASVPAPQAMAVPAPASPSVLASQGPRQAFEHVVAAQTPGFKVELRPDKTTLRIDRDRLAFSVQSARGGYLSLLLMGPDGSVTRIVPNQRLDSVRLQSGQSLAVPQPGWGMSLQAAAPAGEEHVLAIVSTAPRDFSRLGGALQGAYLVIPHPSPANAASGLPTLVGTPQCAGAADCSGDYGAALFTANVVR